MLEKHINCWVEFLEQERGFSHNTSSAYLVDLNYFIKFIEQHHGSLCNFEILDSLTLQDFRSWLAERKRNNFAATSTNRAIAAVKNFYKFSIRYTKLSNKNIFNVRNPKIASLLPKALTEEQAENALEKSVNLANEDWLALRDQAILYLLYGCGLRISEALSVKLKDIENNYLLIRGKGNKQRIVPLMENIITKIKLYTSSCPFPIENNDYVFIGKQGNKLNPGVFQRQIRKLRIDLNLPDSTTPHAFRHSFATHILANGGDLKSIQELLGHQDLSTTQRYTKVDSKHLLEIYNQCHPVASKK